MGFVAHICGLTCGQAEFRPSLFVVWFVYLQHEEDEESIVVSFVVGVVNGQDSEHPGQDDEDDQHGE